MISDSQAQRIASVWHGGGGTALYALASTGAIDTARDDHNAEAELMDCIAWGLPMKGGGRNGLPPRDTTELRNLIRYVQHHGPRDAQPDWYERVVKEAAR